MLRGSSFLKNGFVVDRAFAEYTTNADLTTQIPIDDTLPQNTEGTQILSVSITPKSTTNRIRVRFHGWGGSGAAAVAIIAAAFHNSDTNAYRASIATTGAANFYTDIPLEYEFVPGATTTLTVAIRVGSNQTIRLNGLTTGRLLGGAGSATLVVEEIKA